MPTVKIELLKSRDISSLIKIRDAVMDAVVDSLQLPSNDRNIRIAEYEQEMFQLKAPYEMLVEIAMFAGRSKEAKKRLYTSIVDNLESGQLISGHKVLIIINEQPLENWGIRGGMSADETDLGFSVKV